MKKLNNKGFSLVELIIVIAIMVVLVGILAPQFIKYVESSRQSTDLQNLEQLKTAIEVLATEEGFTSATITINESSGGSADGKIKVGSISPSSLSLDTVANEVKLKSSGWGTTTFTYSSNAWTGTDLTNSNAPGRSTAGVFGR